MIPARHLRQTRRIVVTLIAIQGVLLVLMFWKAPERVPAFLGLAPGQAGNALAWALAALTVGVYVWSATSISAVRHYLLRSDGLKLLCVIAALMAGVLEEVIFRKLLMDFLQARDVGLVVQVLVSAIAFGAVHAVWGLTSISAGINAVLSTALLGGALAVVYLVGDRSLAPCVVAHVVITALIEPGLILAAVGNRLGRWREADEPRLGD